MKNIHILPTDKPSRLFKLAGDLYLHKECGIDPKRNNNIYITSDEEIKEGDWVLLNYPKGVEIDKALPSKLENSFHNADFWIAENKIHNCNHKKIIITDNKDLIKDGVQAIDDEFLEWFIKNPSCEEVKIDKAEHGMIKDDVYYKLSNKIFYKIIIPIEEPKQETLEEAAEREYPHSLYENDWNALQNRKRKEFIKGVKWQQEQIGKSEFLQKLRATMSDAEARRLIFEQFKNK